MKIGLQMYSVRNHMAESPLETTRSVIEMGYKNLEFANLTMADPGVGFAVDPGELRDLVETLGATTVSTHVWPLDQTNIDDVIVFHRELGTQYIVSKFLPATLDEALDSVPNLRMVGERLANEGIGHLIHNGVLRTSAGRKDLDLVLEQVDPDLLGVELDTYWALRSGLDPVEAVNRYGERIRILHQKDIPEHIQQPVDLDAAYPSDQAVSVESLYLNPKYVAEDNFVELGRGSMPLQNIINMASVNSESEYIFVEQDYSELDELESVRLSLTTLLAQSGLSQ
ncbi:sugar phosphate isomerase/epimerase family protein [Subtercola frigoramans]|uniref:Sugar phosphate isomerase/epimerase n=1 Tax=Subtercola frigoramans TaxID=120298 RepID=A0ABS2L749_9MICO|nr:sugar phosphate isomerase/epimerase [Subtercola frigoramans]MBM7472904.1 sugar phosphate isomerase/epimerase [Subtercola frigoramans]